MPPSFSILSSKMTSMPLFSASQTARTASPVPGEDRLSGYLMT